MTPVALPVNDLVKRDVKSVRVVCRKCYGVLFVGPIAVGKLPCKKCGVWTAVRVGV